MPRKPHIGPKSKIKPGNNHVHSQSDSEGSFGELEVNNNCTDYELEYTYYNVCVSRSSQNPRELNQQTSSTSTKTEFSPNRRAPEVINTKKWRKQKTPLQRDKRIKQEVRKLLNRADNIRPKIAFGRLIREMLEKYSTEADSITVTALEALQDSSELYLTQLLSDSYMWTMRRGRVTLGVSDIRLVRYLRGRAETGN